MALGTGVGEASATEVGVGADGLAGEPRLDLYSHLGQYLGHQEGRLEGRPPRPGEEPQQQEHCQE